jgi:catechol 2,3-dioxygenase-like lactoylglutathione lyase family enzyme
MTRGPLHHVELWVPNLARATASIGWLLEALGYQAHQNWDRGRSWRLGDTYIVIERSPALTGETHDRLRPGLNHLAFHAGSIAEPDGLITDAVDHGWSLLFADPHPYAGGTEHCAGYLSDSDGFEVELVATIPKVDIPPTL